MQDAASTSEFRAAMESLSHGDMPGGSLWDVTTVREKSLMLKAWRAARAPILCGIVGYPEWGRSVCELRHGHDGYHQSAGGRWLGYFEPNADAADL